jgi:RNA polymerase sigma factor (sigma-70 family)
MAFVRHRVALVRFLTYRTGSFSDAEDLAQEAFLQSASTRSRVHNPRAYLYQVAANLLRNRYRADQRRARLSEYIGLVGDAAEWRDPERTMSAREDLDRVAAAIDDLPSAARRVFHLARFENLTQREIAAQLGVSTTAVEKSLRRAFARLVAAAENVHS